MGHERLEYNSIPGEVRAILFSLEMAIKREMPGVTGMQITLDGILDEEKPPTLDVRTISAE